MPPEDRGPGPLSGIDFAYEAGLKKIDEQLKSVESLDTKTGVLIAFLGAVIVALLAAILAADPVKIQPILAGAFFELVLGLIVLLLAADLYFAFQAFRMRKLYRACGFRISWNGQTRKSNRRRKPFCRP